MKTKDPEQQKKTHMNKSIDSLKCLCFRAFSCIQSSCYNYIYHETVLRDLIYNSNRVNLKPNYMICWLSNAKRTSEFDVKRFNRNFLNYYLPQFYKQRTVQIWKCIAKVLSIP